MNQEDAYAAWKELRKDVDVDAGFADRVMERIRQHEGPRPRGPHQDGLASRAWQAQVVAALLVVGLALGLLRAGSVIAFVLMTCTGGY